MNKDELLSTLYNRHAAALSVVAQDGNQRVHIDAARMSLALMARDLADKLPDVHQANGGAGKKRVDLRTYEWLNDQIARINDWLAENEVGLYQDPHTDTADAIIAAASGTRAGLKNALAENRRLQEQLNRIGDWLMVHAPDLRNDHDLDTADAIINAAEVSDFVRQKVRILREKLDAALAERDALRADLDDLRDATVESSRDIDEVIAERNGLRQQLAAVHAEDASINSVIVRQVEQLLEQYASDLHERLLSGEFTTVDQALAVQLERNDKTLRAVIDLRDEEAAAAHNAKYRVAELDAENARLRQIEATLRAELADANRRAAVITGNGKSQPAAVLVQAFDADKPSADYTGLDWSSLSEKAQDYRIGLDNKRWKWRDVPKTIRLELVRCVIRNAGDAPTQAQFDAIRPAWMATATAQVAAFNTLWGVLANLDREIEVQQ